MEPRAHTESPEEELRLAIVRLEREHEALWRHPSCVCLSPPLSPMPLLVRVALRVHQMREARLGSLVWLWVLEVHRPWFVVLATEQALVLLFSRSGGLAAAGVLSAERIGWEPLSTRNWF